MVASPVVARRATLGNATPIPSTPEVLWLYTVRSVTDCVICQPLSDIWIRAEHPCVRTPCYHNTSGVDGFFPNPPRVGRFWLAELASHSQPLGYKP